jgi:hypothetical protein
VKGGKRFSAPKPALSGMGFWKHPFWVLGALFLACFLLFNLAEDPGWKNTWTGLSLVCFGGCGLALVCGGIKSGVIPFGVVLFRRAGNPFLFWVPVVVLATISLAVLAAGISALSGEPQ